ncbi:MAG: leucine-rich repeat protein, partial [bacterium]
MKKLLSNLIIFSLFTIFVDAQVSKTINLTTAGTLSSSLTSSEKSTVTSLTITGNIDARDFVVMRDFMPLLSNLNITNVSIASYSGTDGTFGSSISSTYPANEIPITAFFSSSTYSGKATLKDISLPNSVTSIGAAAFEACGLTNVIFGNQLVTIGRESFYGCSFKTLTIPKTVTSIGFVAFNYCSNLEHLTLSGDNLTIYSSAFSRCYNIKTINCLSLVPPILKDTPFDLTNSTLIFVPNSAVNSYKTASGWSIMNIVTEKRVIINNATSGNLSQSIANGGYKPYSNITHLTVNGNLNKNDMILIRDSLSLLIDLDISNVNLFENKLYNSSLQNKEFLETLKLPITLNEICDSVFLGCVNLEGTLTIPNSVSSIGNYAFSNCVRISLIQFSSNLKTIGENAFLNCSGLTGLTIPNTVNSIHQGAFQNCTNLSTLVLGNGISSINNSVFKNCDKLVNIAIPNTVKKIENSAFEDCGSLANVSFGTSVTSIGAMAFSYCVGLINVTIPSPVDTISDRAFLQCWGLNSISLPNSLNSIGEMAFADCNKLSSIIIPNSVKSIGGGALYKCTSLATITVGSNNLNYSSVNGVLFNKNQTVLIQYPAGNLNTSYTIPNTVNIIDASAFSDHKTLTNITMSNNLQTIPNGAFYNCKGLLSITIPNSVTSIGAVAFMNCDSLTSLTIGRGVNYIGGDAFLGCRNLTSVYAYPSNPVNVTADDFEMGSIVYNNTTLHVRSGFINAYKSANVWKDFPTIVDDLSGVFLPFDAGEITGSTSSCIGSSKAYTVPIIADATSYIWTLPSGAMGVSTTNSITVSYGDAAVSGNLSVKGRNSLGDGKSSYLAIVVNPLPVSAGAITGLTTVTKGQLGVAYTVPVIFNATYYYWTLPNGTTEVTTANNISVDYAADAISGSISVQGFNDCGGGIVSSLAITVTTLPLSAGTITGTTAICQGQNSI